MRMVVVLPLPLGPRKPQIWPRSTCMLTWSTTVRLPKRLTRPRTSMAGAHPQWHVHRLAGSSAGTPSGVGQASTMNTSLPRLPML